MRIATSKVKGVQQEKDGRWTVSYYDSDGRRRRKGGFGRGPEGRKAAEAFKLEVDLTKKKGGAVQAPSWVSIFDATQAYLDHLKAHDASLAHRKELAKLVQYHLGPLFERKPVEKLTQQDIVTAVTEYNGRRGVSPRTNQKHIRYLKTIFQYAWRQNMITRNPLEKWTKRKYPPMVPQLNVDDLRKIMDHAAPHLRWALEVEYHLGTRPGKTELFALKWSDVDFNQEAVTVYRSKTRRYDQLKPGRRFMRRLWEMKQLAQSEYIVEYKGKPVKQLATAWRTAKRRAGINYRVRLYDIRHLFGSIMISSGAPLTGVSRAMGHSDINTTMRHYAHLLGGEVEAAMATIPALDGQASPGARRVVPLKEAVG